LRRNISDETVLVTGGLGYIGSHAVVELSRLGYEVVIIDNLVNSDKNRITRILDLANAEIQFEFGDVCDEVFLSDVFKRHSVDSVMHFAGLKSVAESENLPLNYYHTNVAGTICLLKAMKTANIFEFVFSSSATIYDSKATVPLSEDATSDNQSNPYGRSKKYAEQILADAARSDKRWRIIALRYFNPIGADESGLLAEEPLGKPSNIMPNLMKVALNKSESLPVFGNDYDTRDGTGERDYIHVSDLIHGHILAKTFLSAQSGFHAFNLGTGKGCTVIELVDIFSRVTGKKIPLVFKPRRIGDLPVVYADPLKANILLGFEAKKSLEDMCRDSWNAVTSQETVEK